MNKVKILVVEDEMVIAMNICDLLEDLDYDVLEPVSNYDEAVESLAMNEPDLVVLDIQLAGEKDGIDVAEHISENYSTPFIFLTSNSGKATIEKAKKVHPASFLVKPFVREDLYAAIEIAIHNFQDHQSSAEIAEGSLIKDSLFVKEKGTFLKLKLDDIKYFKGQHVYLEIYTSQGNKHLIRSSFTSISDYLPSHFFRTHRSYMVNLNFLHSIKAHHLIIGDNEIPISQKYRQELLRFIKIP